LQNIPFAQLQTQNMLWCFTDSGKSWYIS